MCRDISGSLVLNLFVMLQRKWIGTKMERSHSRSFYLRSRIGWVLKTRRKKNKETLVACDVLFCTSPPFFCMGSG
jgi:hypothetical protein